VIYQYVEDVDATAERALKRGGKLVVPVETHFWGDRTGWIPGSRRAHVGTRNAPRGDNRRLTTRSMVENRVGEKLTEIQDVTFRGPAITNAPLISGLLLAGNSDVTLICNLLLYYSHGWPSAGAKSAALKYLS
jgi:hypothetical protein